MTAKIPTKEAVELTVKASVQDALNFIDSSMLKTTEHILQTGFGFYCLKEACEREKVNFGETVEERYNINKTNASRWVKIGAKKKLLKEYRHILPSNYSTIYSLLTLPAGAFQKVINSGKVTPSMTFEDAEHVKQIYKADAAAKKEAKAKGSEVDDTNPFENDGSDPIFSISSETESQDTKIQNPFGDEKEAEPIEGEFTEVEETKPSKKAKKMSLIEALEILQINLDDQFMLAQAAGDYTENQIIEAIALLRGE